MSHSTRRQASQIVDRCNKLKRIPTHQMKPGFLSSRGDPIVPSRPAQRCARMLRAARRGAFAGLAAALLVFGGVLAVVEHCLPFHISSPQPPWPWYCSDPAYSAISYLAFPVNLLTNDLARALLFAPFSLLLYILLGVLLGLVLGISRPSAPGS